MKIRSNVLVGLLSSALLVAAVAQAAGYKKASNPKESVSFRTKAIGEMVNIDGSIPGLSVAQQEGDNLVFKADLNKLSTGIKLRDEHAKKALKVEANPMAKLTVPVGSVSPGSGKSGSGDFTLAGVTKKLPFKYDAEAKGDTVDVKGMFRVKLSDFNIEKPCKAGVCVDDTVSVIVNFSMKK